MISCKYETKHKVLVDLMRRHLVLRTETLARWIVRVLFGVIYDLTEEWTNRATKRDNITRQCDKTRSTPRRSHRPTTGQMTLDGKVAFIGAQVRRRTRRFVFLSSRGALFR